MGRQVSRLYVRSYTCLLSDLNESIGLDGSAAAPYGKTSAWTEVIRLRVVMDGPREGLECVSAGLAL